MKLNEIKNLNIMYQNLFPITIIDNFYPDPDAIRNYALEQDFSESSLQYPGKRTKPLDDINPELNDFFFKTVMKVFYPMELSFDCSFISSFQLIEARDSDQYSVRNKGWIHHDAVVIGGLVYLSKDPEPDTGTTLYRSKHGYHQHKDTWNLVKADDYLNRPGFNLEYTKKLMEESLDCVVETVKVENVYNRCVLFGGNVIHAAQTFGTRKGKDARLTQPFFCEVFNPYMDTFPMCRAYTAG